VKARRSSNWPSRVRGGGRLGRSVKWDGEQEIILDDPKANRLLEREYRAPWKYPKIALTPASLRL